MQTNNFILSGYVSGAIDPWFITGFTDAEGCFTLSLVRNNKMKLGWRIRPSFQIHLHEKDRPLLEEFVTFFGVGKIYTKSKDSVSYLVSSIKDLQVIQEHFEKYPLLTKKRADFHLWTQILYLVQNKEHNTMEGLTKIVALRASLNKGLNEELKATFPTIVPVERPKVEDQEIKDPNWLSGFTSGEGCFLVRIINSTSNRLGVQVKLVFQITQHSRDEQLMRSLIEYLDCGLVFNQTETAVVFKVMKFSDLIEKIIPFFVKYPILGVKAKDFVDWCKVAELMKNKKHLTTEGLNQIRQIKAGMNKGR